MATEKIIKYNIVLVDAVTHDCKILFTTKHYNDAIEYMTSYIDEEYDLNEWVKCFHENKKSCSIYKYHYVFRKQLINKIHVLEFADWKWWIKLFYIYNIYIKIMQAFCQYKFICGSKKNTLWSKFIRGGGDFCNQHKKKVVESKIEAPKIEEKEIVIPKIEASKPEIILNKANSKIPKVVKASKEIIKKGKPIKLRKSVSSSSEEYIKPKKIVEKKKKHKKVESYSSSDSSSSEPEYIPQKYEKKVESKPKKYTQLVCSSSSSSSSSFSISSSTSSSSDSSSSSSE